MEFQILGPLEVRADGRVLPLGAGRQRALLALLLLHANETVSRDRLIDELWGDRPPRTVAKALQGHVSALRRLLEPDRASGADGRVILTRGSGYELRLEDGQLDLERFERLREEGRRAHAEGRPERAAARLREALGLWRGSALADLAYEPFAQAEITRLEELRVATLEDRLEADLAGGRHAELIGELEALVNEHPLRERPRGQLMLALYRAGRQVEALEAYQGARQTLVDELGIEPARELRELHQAILRQDPGLDHTPVAEPPEGGAENESHRAFVGRHAELAQLRASLDHATAGHGRLFLLAGEPGIGKSRLAEELVRHARARGGLVLTGRCWEAGGAPAFWPWVQSLRGYIRTLDRKALRDQLGTGAADVAQILPELRELLPGLPEPAQFESEGMRFRLFDAAVNFLRNATHSGPLVIALDDLHAADAPSLLLLQFLARELGSMRMLVVGTYRDVDPTPGQALAEMLGAVVREPVTRRLSLRGLAEGEVADYVEQTASELASPKLVAALHHETEGNPLFVSEMVRLLSVEGVASESTGEIRLAVPQNVHDVIARRLSHLSEECNRVLVLASVLGREFGPDTLARLGEVSEDELLETLDEAMAGRIVSDVPGAPGRLRFAHVLIRDTLYQGLTTARRIRLHRLVVEALDELYGADPGPHSAELAHHAVAGGDYDRGAIEARRAADHAFAVLAYEEAARLYEVALEAVDFAALPDETTRCELLLSLGEAESRAGNTTAAKRSILEAAAIARRLGLPPQLGRAAAAYGGRFVFARAVDDELVPLIEEALNALPNEEVELRARLMARLAAAVRAEYAKERSDTLSKEAVELARHSGNDAALAYALDARAGTILAPDTIHECLALSDELREVAERIGDRERFFHGHMHRVIALVVVGKLDEVEGDLETAGRIAPELREPVHLWDVTGAKAMLALAAGRLDEAEDLSRQALAHGEHALPAHAFPVYRLQRYALSDFRGGLAEVEPEIRELASQRPQLPAYRCVLAHLQARLGRLSDARRRLDKLAADDFSILPFDEKWLYATSLLAETAALIDDAGAAESLYQLLLPWAELNVVEAYEGIRGSVARYLGLLATTTQRWIDAELHFEEALAANARMGVLPWLARTQHDYARMLLTRGRGGDRERARELVETALATYRDLGMTPSGA